MTARKFFWLIPSALAIHSTAYSVNMDAVEYHGYVRAGAGTNDKGGDQVCFTNPGAGSNEFRLGNECDTYGELALKANHLVDEKGSGFFYSQARLAFQQPGESNWEDKNPVHIREIFAEGGGFSGSSLTYWAGKRFYRENDVYMNDWYYFADMSSNGGGVGNIPLGIGKLHLALLREVKSDHKTDIGKPGVTVYDARFKDIKLSTSDSLMGWLALGRSPGSTDAENGTKYKAMDGNAAGVLWSHDIRGGFNHLALMLGHGLLDEYNIYGNVYVTSEDSSAEKSSQRVRIVEHLTTEFGRSLETHAVLYSEMRDSGKSEKSRENWYGLGVHPVYKLTDHYQIASELGSSIVAKQGSAQRQLTRVTVAPQVAMGRSIWARPVVRAFYSYTTWNHANKGKVDADGPYANRTSGANFGVQSEFWF